jgi:hypothetical protein
MKTLTSIMELPASSKGTAYRRKLLVVLLLSLSLHSMSAHSQPMKFVGQDGSDSSSIPDAQLLQPQGLVRLLKAPKDQRPLVLQIGSRVLFDEAHIPGSEYIGPASQEAGLQALRHRAQALPRDKFLVIYCGCCPWSKCPNIRPAYRELISMGFTHLRVLYLRDNFGANWVSQGYPTEKGE